MLLSIDRVLQLLAEGKSLEKIAEFANCSIQDVQQIIEDSRVIIGRFEKSRSKKKIILKKHKNGTEGEGAPGDDHDMVKELFEGAELTAVPMSSALTIYVDGASKGNPGPAGIGIVILDSDDRQVGKVSKRIGVCTNNRAEYQALINALKIAIYFDTRRLKIRTDSELIVMQLEGHYSVKNKGIMELYTTAVDLIKRIPNFKIEHVSRNFNDKADYLAKKATEPNPQ